MKRRAREWIWQKPILNVAGQTAFWNAQAEGYAGADMTNDNQPEMEAVIGLCRKVNNCADIVTLGGAVGCRDPKMILDAISAQDDWNGVWPRVTFNDLSPRQVNYAREIVLRPYAEQGMQIEYLPGQISKVCGRISKQPRRLIVGVYGCRSFFQANEAAGYKLSGYDEYLKNQQILGSEFIFEIMRLDSQARLLPSGIRAQISQHDSAAKKHSVKESLSLLCESSEPGTMAALQIIGRHPERPGFFLSHWYTRAAFRQMIAQVFDPCHFTVTEKYFPKGMAFAIEPVCKGIQGVVTVLNNVVGNVLPKQQISTLQSIKEMMC